MNDTSGPNEAIADHGTTDSYFGEVSFLDPGPRSATAFVTQDKELLMLDREAVDSLAEQRQREAGLVALKMPATKF